MLRYIKDKKGTRYLPFQYYDKLNFISFPTVGKVPQIRNWNHIEKTVPQITWYNNVAILTGKINEITVVDIDDINDWLDISKGRTINTPTVKTSGSSQHLYFKYEPELKTRNKININGKRKHIDIRNNDSSVVAPPSIVNGEKYKWIISPEDVKIKKMPRWLYSILIQTNSDK